MPEFTHQWNKQNPDCGPLISTIAHSETVGVVTSLSRTEYSWQSRQSTQHSELSSSRHCRLAIRTCQRPRLPQEGTSLISHIRLRCHLLSLRCSVNSADERSIQAKGIPAVVSSHLGFVYKGSNPAPTARNRSRDGRFQMELRFVRGSWRHLCVLYICMGEYIGGVERKG